jgi:hypothetical protein
MNQPGYYDTVRYIYRHIEFHISEDEAYEVLDAFIAFWNSKNGQLVYEDEFKSRVLETLKWSLCGKLGNQKILRIVELIIAYLRENGFYQAAA